VSTENNTRKSGQILRPANSVTVNATCLDFDKAVSVEFGEYATGTFIRYLSIDDARALSAALALAADAYEHESARDALAAHKAGVDYDA
jgi:hypothetical protein